MVTYSDAKYRVTNTNRVSQCPYWQRAGQRRVVLKRGTVNRPVCASAVAVLVLVVTGCGPAGGTAAAPPAPTTVYVTTTEPGATVTVYTPTSTPTPSPALEPPVLMRASGVGQGHTGYFKTTRDWSVGVWFDCSNAGGTGTLVLLPEDNLLAAPIVNDYSTVTTDIGYVPNDPGSHFVTVLTSCQWRVTVYDGNYRDPS